MKDLLEKIANLTFGTEIETENIDRYRAASAVADAFKEAGLTVTGPTGFSDCYTIVANGRSWNFKYDGSLADNGGCEMITPILTWQDMDILQVAVRALRHAGAKVNGRCGMHVHIGTQGWTPQNIANLVKKFYRQEDIILKAAGTASNRLGHYTRPTDPQFIDRLERIGNMTLDAINMAWFGYSRPQYAIGHYEGHRYRTLNLNNLWRESKTVEFRLFEGTLHAGEVKANIALCLALAANALAAKNPRGGRRTIDAHDGKFDCRALLVHLGLNGEAFKTVRQHLTKRLKGASTKHEWLAAQRRREERRAARQARQQVHTAA